MNNPLDKNPPGLRQPAPLLLLPPAVPSLPSPARLARFRPVAHFAARLAACRVVMSSTNASDKAPSR